MIVEYVTHYGTFTSPFFPNGGNMEFWMEVRLILEIVATSSLEGYRVSDMPADSLK